jgi:lysophospholipase L1-like esterase
MKGVLPFRRKALYGALTVVSAAAVMAGALLALDVYLHHRVQNVSGVNVWGYRGPAIGHKHSGEIRVEAIGGSTVFGYGLPWNQAWPFYLEARIDARRAGEPRVTVVNLGIPTDSARTFVATLDDYGYLKSDVAILYEGYNDLGLPEGKNKTNPDVPHYLAWRHQSPIFRWTGYFPIFPLVLSEKAMLLTHGGDLNAGYDSREIVFRPGLATRATAGVMKATAGIGMALERRFGRLTATGPILSAAYDADCGHWSQYCGAMEDAIRHAIDQGQRVLVVTQPYLSDLHVDQQRALSASLQRHFGDDRRVRYLNLGRAIDLSDPELAYDRMHLTPAGNDRIAAALAPAVIEVLK